MDSNQELSQEAHIGELGQLRFGRRHAQVLTYLAGESWARVASENERVAHCGQPLRGEGKEEKRRGLEEEKLGETRSFFSVSLGVGHLHSATVRPAREVTVGWVLRIG